MRGLGGGTSSVPPRFLRTSFEMRVLCTGTSIMYILYCTFVLLQTDCEMLKFR